MSFAAGQHKARGQKTGIDKDNKTDKGQDKDK
jgi:hypothetical protein